MSDSAGHSGLSRRRLLAGLATISGSVSAAGVGTWSLFSDDEQRNISVKAGTVSLSVEGGGDPVVTIDDVTSGVRGTERLKLTNTGTLDATLVVCVDDISYRRSSESGDESDTPATVDFEGCGQAKVTFEGDSDEPVDVTAEYGDGEREKQTVPVDEQTSPLKLKRSGGNNGYLESVSIDDTTYRNDACTHVSSAGNEENESSGDSESADDDSPLADSLTVEIGLDNGAGGSETLFGPSEVETLRDEGACVVADSRLSGDTTAELFVDWRADADIEDADDHAVELDLEVSLQA